MGEGATPAEAEGSHRKPPNGRLLEKTPPGPWNFKLLILYINHFHILSQPVFPTSLGSGKELYYYHYSCFADEKTEVTI